MVVAQNWVAVCPGPLEQQLPVPVNLQDLAEPLLGRGHPLLRTLPWKESRVGVRTHAHLTPPHRHRPSSCLHSPTASPAQHL